MSLRDSFYDGSIRGFRYGHGDTVYCEDTEEREDAGTPAIIQKVRAALAFRVKEWVGEACIEEREQRMLAFALRWIRKTANPSLRLLLGEIGRASCRERV